MSVSIDYLQKRKELLIERAKAFDRASAILSTAASEKRALTAEEEQERQRCWEAVDKFDQLIKLLEEDEQRAEKLRTTGDNRIAGLEDTSQKTDSDAQAEAQRLQYRAFLRGGVSLLSQDEQTKYASIIDRLPEELRTLTTTSASGLIPTTMMDQISVAMKYAGGIVDAATIITTDTGSPFDYPTLDDTSNTGEQTNEGSSVNAADPTVSKVTFRAYLIDSKVLKVSVHLINQAGFNLEEYINQELGRRIGRHLNYLCTLGSGSNTIRGVLTAASAGPTIFPATSISYTDLIDLEYSVDRAYRNYNNPQCGYMFSDATCKVLRKLTDDSNNPIFRRGQIIEGLSTNREPDTINGWRFWINNDLPAPAQGQKTVLFGDFSKYVIRRVAQPVVVRLDQRYMDELVVGYLMYQMFDGNLLISSAVKYLTQGAS